MISSRAGARRTTVAALVAGALAVAGCASSSAAHPSATTRRGSAVANDVGPRRERPFATSSVWNTATTAATRWYDTPGLHRLQDGTFRHWWVNTKAVGLVWARPTDPAWTFDLPDYDAPEWGRHRKATRFTMRAPADLREGADDDHILVVIDATTGEYVEVWEAQVDAATHTVHNRDTKPGWARGNLRTGPGAGSSDNNDGVRASNFSWAAGLITGSDIAANAIDHALVVGVPPDMLLGGSPPVGPFRAPATGGNGAWPTGTIVMGSKLGIPADTAMPSGLSALGRLVFRSLQRYGAYVGDVVGGTWPMFYSDNASIPSTDAIDSGPFDPLVGFWDHDGSADMEKIGPLLRVADYQP